MALRHQSSGWCLRSIYATLETMTDAPRGTPSVDVLNTYGVSSGARLRYHEHMTVLISTSPVVCRVAGGGPVL